MVFLSVIPAKAGIYRSTLDESALDPRFRGDDKREQTHDNSPITGRKQFMKNKEIAEIFNNIADILEIKGENPFRVRAYRRAAFAIRDLSSDIGRLVVKQELGKIPGIGKDLAQKIEEYIRTGKMMFYETLRNSIPGSVLEFMDVPGIGPKTAHLLYERLGIKSLKDLEKQAKSGKIAHVRGIGDKTIVNILKGIEFISSFEKRILLPAGVEVSSEIISVIKKLKEVGKINVAGSVRRKKETIGDVDIVAASNKPKRIMQAFVSLPNVMQVIAHGPTKSSIRTTGGVQVDLRIVPPESFGAALAYMTGSKAHNIRLRKIAVKKGLKVNEYGVFNISSAKKVAGKNENGIYSCLGLSPVPPEMREDRGEIELAERGNIPRLLTMGDIKCDLHMHSALSDGVLSLGKIIDIAKKRGYSYIAVTEHSKTLKIARGLDEQTLLGRMKQIDNLNRKLKGFKILKGAEVDILKDGSMDYGDDILKELDFVIGAIHSGFKQPRDVMTKRIIRAMNNKHVHMIAHLTGRLLGVRDGYEVDINEILKAARDTNTAIEINAFPQRLDLNDIHCRMAKDMGVMLGIGTDSHREEHFDNMLYGVDVARRGWLEKSDILNTYNLAAFRNKIRK